MDNAYLEYLQPHSLGPLEILELQEELAEYGTDCFNLQAETVSDALDLIS